jgi:hypothetical protein
MEKKLQAKFHLDGEDYAIVDAAARFTRTFLCLPEITPAQIVGLGRALYALEQMPQTTPGVFVDFGISLRTGARASAESRYWDFRITDSSFSISTGGHHLDPSGGRDEPGSFEYEIAVASPKKIKGDVYGWMGTLGKALDREPELIVDDQCEPFEMEEDDDIV